MAPEDCAPSSKEPAPGLVLSHFNYFKPALCLSNIYFNIILPSIPNYLSKPRLLMSSDCNVACICSIIQLLLSGKFTKELYFIMLITVSTRRKSTKWPRDSKDGEAPSGRPSAVTYVVVNKRFNQRIRDNRRNNIN
jgi:hypothetical protein